MPLRRLPPSMVSVVRENVRNMHSEPPSRENAPFTQFTSVFEFLSPLDLIFKVLDHRESPLMSLPPSIVEFLLFRLGPTLGTSVTWSALGPAQLRKANANI